MTSPGHPNAVVGHPASFWRLTWSDLRRLAGRRRALWTVLGLTGAGAFLTRIDPSYTPDSFWIHYSPFLTFACVIAGMVVSAGSLAEDRGTRHGRTVLLHGYTRRAYAWAKALSVAGSALLVSGLGFLGFLLAARLMFPPSIWTRPLLPDLVGVAFLAWVAGGTALMGFVASSLTRNEYVASFTPFLVLYACVFLLDASDLSPPDHVDAWHGVAAGHPAPPFSIPGEFLYWLVLGALLAAAGSELYARRQGD